MSVNSIDNELKNNNKNNQSIGQRIVTNDNSSLKSETSSMSRPLQFGPKDVNDNPINQSVYCETTVTEESGGSTRVPTLGQCHNDSVEERTVCCANMAINLYTKALESAKRALPHKTKQSRQQVVRSFGEDFESVGPEGFNYLDDGQTECSYDYRDIEFNRDSLFRPDSCHDIPGLEADATLVQHHIRYGLPEVADRVEPYVPKSTQMSANFETESTESKTKEEVVNTPVTPPESFRDMAERPAYDPNPMHEIEVKESEDKTYCPKVREHSQKEMDLMAKRTSQLIIGTALETIAKSKVEPKPTYSKIESKTEKLSKKSSAESSKELRKEQKLLEKKLKEEEKCRRRMERETKEIERKERKKLFDKFRTEDKQKKKIMKKQKQFEKLREKNKMSKNSSKDDLDMDVEADDEYEPSGPNEDMDVNKNSEPQVSSETTTAVVEDVVKYEFIENVREIGVTFVPSEDGMEDNVESERKSKSKITSFRLPFSKIFAKKPTKTSTKTEKTELVVSEAIDSGVDVKTCEVNRYENVEMDVEVRPQTNKPSIVVNEVLVSQWETEEEDKQFVETNDSPKIVGKKRKKSKTRAKLDRIKAKAMESLPKITSIVPKSWSKREESQHRELEYDRFGHSTLNQRFYYSDFDCVSDSELCDSVRRTGALGRSHVYEEMAATQERLDAYMSPVSGPLRPPRRFSSLKCIKSVSSVPTLATQELMRRPKRTPPPRPPPPRPPPVMVSTDSANDWPKRRPKQKVPPNIYYTNLRMNYKPKRRFPHIRPQHMDVMVSHGQGQAKPPLPCADHMKNQSFNEINSDLKQRFLSETHVINASQRGAPTPPPRRRRSAQRSQTVVNPLVWQPFIWKYRRCRSLTELDVRSGSQSREDVRPVRAATIRPSRPPLPPSRPQKKSECDVRLRPLPTPPIPPRPKCVSTTVRTRDVGVSTGMVEMNEKETQIDETNESLREYSVAAKTRINGNEVGENTRSSTLWFDAYNMPEPSARANRSWDEDTINDDISSITSNYMSLSDTTVTESREQTPVPTTSTVGVENRFL